MISHVLCSGDFVAGAARLRPDPNNDNDCGQLARWTKRTADCSNGRMQRRPQMRDALLLYGCLQDIRRTQVSCPAAPSCVAPYTGICPQCNISFSRIGTFELFRFLEFRTSCSSRGTFERPGQPASTLGCVVALPLHHGEGCAKMPFGLFQ